MSPAIDIQSHPNFTVDEIIQHAGWPVPSPDYRKNLQLALDYFQSMVPKSILRQPDDAGPWNLEINGTKFKLLNWLQGIDFHWPVDARHWIHKGADLIAFKDPSILPGQVRGNWYTFSSTRQGKVAIHSTQTRMHHFKARMGFICLKSRASDAYVGWLSHLPAEYRRGGATQLFIWDAQQMLDPAK